MLACMLAWKVESLRYGHSPYTGPCWLVHGAVGFDWTDRTGPDWTGLEWSGL